MRGCATLPVSLKFIMLLSRRIRKHKAGARALHSERRGPVKQNTVGRAERPTEPGTGAGRLRLWSVSCSPSMQVSECGAGGTEGGS